MLEDLPSPILADILGRLPSSGDLAACRLASRSLRSASLDVRSVRLLCSHDRFLRSRRSFQNADDGAVVPFKSVVTNLVSLLRHRHLESISIGVERPLAAPPNGGEDEFDERDDLHLTAVGFVAGWLPGVGGRLGSLSLSDFWAQSCWRASEVLALISNSCETLHTLEIRYAWLSVEGLKPLMSLRSLTLEFIRLDDEDLSKINECFPSLEHLNMIGVGGLHQPKIHLPCLKNCYWTVSNVPLSLSIIAPTLVKLKLGCVEPKFLVLKTPSLLALDLMVEKQVAVIEMESFLNLKFLRIKASQPRRLVQVLSGCSSVRELEIEVPISGKSAPSPEPVNIEDIMRSFPDLSSLKLSPGAWCQLGSSISHGSSSVQSNWESLRTLSMHLPQSESELSSLSFILDVCSLLCEVVFLVPDDLPADSRSRLVFKIARKHPRVRWKWITNK